MVTASERQLLQSQPAVVVDVITVDAVQRAGTAIKMAPGGSPLTTHVLDTSIGKPARHLPIKLSHLEANGQWTCISEGRTNDDGRCGDLVSDEQFVRGQYKLTFDTAQYFRFSQRTSFYPYVDIVFEVTDTSSHHHVPLLLSPYGYSTYRGS